MKPWEKKGILAIFFALSILVNPWFGLGSFVVFGTNGFSGSFPTWLLLLVVGSGVYLYLHRQRLKKI